MNLEIIRERKGASHKGSRVTRAHVHEVKSIETEQLVVV